MRDKRYLISRRRYDRFVRTDPFTFKVIDETERRLSKPPSVLTFWQKMYFGSCFAVLIGMLVYAMISHYRQAPPEPEPSSYQLARAAAAERAAAFVTALGFEAGPAVCRALKKGDAYCTIRVAGSNKTFALWCSRKHPTCIENLPRE
jgi:hypothetical protein